MSEVKFFSEACLRLDRILSTHPDMKVRVDWRILSDEMHQHARERGRLNMMLQLFYGLANGCENNMLTFFNQVEMVKRDFFFGL